MLQLLPVHPDLPNCFAVYKDGEDLGDIELLPDGTWVGDVSAGNAATSRPFASRDEAVAYVLDPIGNR